MNILSVDQVHRSFADGRITRAAFVRRLVGFGMSSAIAIAYAEVLTHDVALAKGGQKPEAVPNKPPLGRARTCRH